ncbi:uncharacterized protein N7498_010513 [Penicillium cinerascens]|uniref:F-box domain-containing protein n=1 Tax=Penicillium cinerascens TaxID=70096 RepID=A0A9W9M798_9EURO|nr:uncharacterized protein N7498_010513 [Penicillium cinerascens]KAJ5191528.1 hypothetical protein N7498_010513 [Penicillium cinerascens]
MTLGLPLELFQKILLYLDIESFYSVTRTCRTWRDYALAHYVLRKQLKSTPMTDSLPDNTSYTDLVSWFNYISKTQLLGLRVSNCKKIRNSRSNCANNVPIWSTQGKIWTEMQGLDLKIASPLGTIQLTLSPSIFPRPGEVSKAQQWFCSGGQAARYQIALSGKQDLVAVALGNKVHIYSVGVGLTSEDHVECAFQGTSLNWAQSVEFAESDTLLRCEINRGGATVVQYRGFGTKSTGASLSGLEYWQTALSNVYLASDTVPRIDWFGLRGVRLLPCTGNHPENPSRPRSGHPQSFVAIMQRGNQTSYGLCSQSSDGNAAIAWEVAYQNKSTDEQVAMKDDPRWNPAKLPLGQCHKTILAISDDARLLAIFEQPSNTRPGALYICSLHTHEMTEKPVPAKIVRRWPLLLGILEHNIIGLRVIRQNSLDCGKPKQMYTVEAQSYGFNFGWSLSAY